MEKSNTLHRADLLRYLIQGLNAIDKDKTKTYKQKQEEKWQMKSAAFDMLKEFIHL